MKFFLTISLLFSVLLATPARAEYDLKHLADDPTISRAISKVATDEVKRQLGLLKKHRAACFNGAFEREVSDFFYGLARGKKLHKHVLAVVGSVLNEDEVRALAHFYSTRDGDKAMRAFTRTIHAKNQGKLNTNHPFFESELGKKIVANVDTFKNRAKWQSLLILGDSGIGAAKILFKEFDLKFRCKNVQDADAS